MNEDKNTTYQNLWDPEKAVLRQKFIAVSASIKKEERCIFNNLTIHLKELETKEQAKH